MSVKSVTRKVGNSVGLLLPKSLGIQEGQRVLITPNGDHVMLRTLNQRQTALVNLVDDIFDSADTELRKLVD